MIAATDVTPDIVKLVLSYGITPIVLITMSTFGLVYFKPSIDDLKAVLADCREDLKQAHAQTEAKNEEVKQLNEIMRDVMVPAVAKSSEILQRVTDEIWRLRGAA